MPPLYLKTRVCLLNLVQSAFDTLGIFSSPTGDKKTNEIDANH